MKNTTPQKNVYANATLVTGISVAERALGFLYRIVLARLIGAEGMGLYQVAFSVYAVLHTFGAGGLPVCVSRLISKSKAENDPRGERAAVSAGVFISLAITLPVSALFFLFAEKTDFLFSDPRCISVFKLLLVSLAFSCVYDVLRGSFWANKRFFSSAVLELFEETVMVIVGVLFLRGATDPLDGAERAALSASVACLFSFVFIVVLFLCFGGRFSPPKKQLKLLFNATMPVTFVRASNSLVNSAISTLFPVMLVRAGYSSSEALRLFGVVSGMALPVLMIPVTLIGSLSLVLVPELSEDYYRNNKTRLYKNIGKGIRTAALIAILLYPFFFALGEDLCRLAYASELAGKLVFVGAPMLLPMSVAMITTSMINSMGMEKYTFAFYFLGAAAMILCVLFLPARCGVYAYLVGMFANFSLLSVCDLLLLRKKCPALFSTQKREFLTTAYKAAATLVPACIFGKLFVSLFSKLLGETLCALASALALLVITALLCLLTGLFEPPKNPQKEKKSKKIPTF